MKQIQKLLASATTALGLVGAMTATAAPARALDLDVDLGPGVDVGVSLDLSLDPASWSVVVKVADGCTLGDLSQAYDVTKVDTLMASRQVHLVQSRDPLRWTPRQADDLATRLSADSCVVYAERNHPVQVEEEGFHAWPSGLSAPSTQQEWQSQPATTRLNVASAQQLSQGQGIRVAVLDTGVDPTHPYFNGTVTSGWDYVDDDANPAEVAGSEAYGHGTFVAGLVHLVAPRARIIPMRVLDKDGNGDGYQIAEAIRDAVALGARVINLSFGTTNQVESKVLTDMIRYARSKGVVTVAAAGNDGDELKHWPAAQPEAISVSALDTANDALAGYSTRGDWVDVAALGTDLISLVPGGGFDVWSGTSMAAPVVAGQVALVIAADSRQYVGQVEDRVVATSQPLSGVKVRYGRIDITGSVKRALW
jgi:subtilisin family serine protease